MNVGGFTDISLRLCFQYFWVYIQKKMLDHMQFYFQFFEEPHIVFLSSCTVLHSYQQRTRVPMSQNPCQHLLYSLLLHLNWYEVVSHLWFLFVFPLWLMILNIFYVLFSHLHILFRKLYIQVVCPFKKYFCCCLVVFVSFNVFWLASMIVALRVILMLNSEGQIDVMGWGGKVRGLNLAWISGSRWKKHAYEHKYVSMYYLYI